MEAARDVAPGRADPEAVANRLRRAGEAETARLRSKPDRLGRIAFGPEGSVVHDPPETLVR